MSQAELASVRVLMACNDAHSLEMAQRVLDGHGHKLIAVTDVAEAIATASVERPDIAFIDVTMEDEAALALVHHLPAVCPGIAVHALAPSSRIELAAQAISLGAAGMLVSPPSGDSLLQAINDIRSQKVTSERQASLEAENGRLRSRLLLLEWVARLARGSGQSEAVRACVEAVTDASGASGVALYATFEEESECIRLAASGSAKDSPSICRTEGLLRYAEDRGARIVPMEANATELGVALVEQPHPDRLKELDSMTEVVAAIMALLDSRNQRRRSVRPDARRVYTFAYLQDMARRELEKAKRHGRRVAVASVVIDSNTDPKLRPEVEDLIVSVVRDTDVLAAYHEDEYLLLLPETGTMGAHACRRRLAIRAEGDRRARTSSSDRRGTVSARPARGLPVSVGTATYPHDGTSLERLVHVAGQRARDQVRSAVHALGLAPLPLPEIVDTLLARSMLEAGIGAPRPLDLSMTALAALASQACREAKRGGAAAIHATFHPGVALVSAARQAVRDAADVTVRVIDVRAREGCNNLEGITVVAEHGCWVCCGRVDRDRFRGVHACDPLLADLVTQRLLTVGKSP